jgi:hypothetical protein
MSIELKEVPMANSTDFTRTLQISFNTTEQNKAFYGDSDQRFNLHELELAKLEKSFMATVRKQAESVACLMNQQYLIPTTKNSWLTKEEGWTLHPQTPTLAQKVEQKFKKENVQFGEKEAFRDQLAPGFGTAFLVGKRLVMTSAHCICQNESSVVDQTIILKACLVFGFHEIKKRPSEYFFAKNQVYWIKKVINYQFVRIKDRNHEFTEWTDWALLELNEDVPFTPLRMNMMEKIADKLELYMLGHPGGVPLKKIQEKIGR